MFKIGDTVFMDFNGPCGPLLTILEIYDLPGKSGQFGKCSWIGNNGEEMITDDIELARLTFPEYKAEDS